MSRYIATITRTNFGSVVDLQYEWVGNLSRPNFKKYFVNFYAQKKEFFKGYREFIKVDGCHLKDLYKRVILVAIVIDVNYGVYHLTLSVMDIENF